MQVFIELFFVVGWGFFFTDKNHLIQEQHENNASDE